MERPCQLCDRTIWYVVIRTILILGGGGGGVTTQFLIIGVAMGWVFFGSHTLGFYFFVFVMFST